MPSAQGRSSGSHEFLETIGRWSIISWNHGLEPVTFFLKEITFPMVSFTVFFYSPSLSPGFPLTLHSCLHIQTSDKCFFPLWNMQSDSLSLNSKVWWGRTQAKLWFWALPKYYRKGLISRSGPFLLCSTFPCHNFNILKTILDLRTYTFRHYRVQKIWLYIRNHPL